MNGGARMSRSLKKIKRDADNCSLHLRIIGLPAGVAERKVREDETRNSTLLDDILCRAHYYCREAVRLKVSSDQTHGLVAYGSERYEKRNIHGVSATKLQHCRGILIDGPTLAEVRRHAVEPW